MKHLVVAAATALVALASTAWAGTDAQSFEQIQQGRYLATVGDCAACHTASGGKPYAGGKPLETPFGKLVGPNLTPDDETGIGAWTDDDFVNALLNGTGHGGEHLYPGMPYTYFTKMTRDDALAIRAFLNTLPSVHNVVRSNQLPFPFDIRAGMIAWDGLYFKKGRFQPVADKSPEWNRGAFLVEGPGHCGMCHTPKTALGGDEVDHALQGGKLAGWFAPNLTSDPHVGLGAWSPGDIVAYLHDGHNSKTGAAGPMAEVVTDSTSRMTEDDLRAIAVYLKDVPAGEGAAPSSVAANDPAMHTGQAVYVDNCSACHAGDGSGSTGLFPTLRDNSGLQQTSPIDPIAIVLSGSQSVATKRLPTGPIMPAFAWKLTDGEVAAVLTYIRNSWGNHAPAVTAGDVAGQRSADKP